MDTLVACHLNCFFDDIQTGSSGHAPLVGQKDSWEEVSLQQKPRSWSLTWAVLPAS